MAQDFPRAGPDEWRQAIDALNDAGARIRGDAGQTPMPEHDALLARLTRRLRTLGDADVAALADDFREACLRVLCSADPAAPLAALGLVQDTLRRLLQRHALAGMPRAA